MFWGWKRKGRVGWASCGVEEWEEEEKEKTGVER